MYMKLFQAFFGVQLLLDPTTLVTIDLGTQIEVLNSKLVQYNFARLGRDKISTYATEIIQSPNVYSKFDV